MRRVLPLAVRAVAAALLVSSCTASTTTSPTPPPIWVIVNGEPVPVTEGTTLHALMVARSLRPTDGNLLAVDGSVLEHRVERGRILVNGERVKPVTVLSAGDRVHVVNGRDRTEPAVRRVRDVGRRVGDPERTLDVYRTQMVTTVGTVSGMVESRVVRSLGNGVAPHAVALTFDDGPWPGATERLLRVLRRFHVHATFFMIGRQAASYPGIVRDVRRAGHEIGNHSFDHPTTLAGLSLTDRWGELRRASTILGADRVRATLFRPPGGWYDPELVQQAREQGMRLVTWSVDPRDWRSHVSSRDIARSVLQQVEPGSIILLHDGGGDAAHTIRALPDIIRGVRKRGLHFVTIPAHPV